jgi:hypothetical protein
MDGSKVYSFEDIAQEGTSHFKYPFKENFKVNIVNIIKVASLFPIFINPEANHKLMEKITREELEKILHSFQKDKSPGLDGFPVEFYKG